MQQALFAALLVSVATGVIGVFVVVNRMVFVSGGVAHTAYGGVGLATFLGFSPVLGAFIFTAAAALCMGLVQRRAGERSDTIIGVLWALGMAAGVIFTELTPGYRGDLMSYLFGSILMVSATDLWLMLIFDIVIVVTAALFYREFVAISFDETFASTRNVPVTAFYLLLLLLIACAVVLLMRATGLILVIALLTIPVSIASWFTRGLGRLIVYATLLSALFCYAGLGLSVLWNFSSGATIILTAGAVYLVGQGVRLVLRRP